MQNKKYSVVVFDLGNVLLPFNYDGVIKKFNAVSPGLGDKFLDFYKTNYDIHRKFERGDLTEDEFITVMLEVLEHKISREEFLNDFAKVFTVNYDVAGLLPKLKNNFKLVLLSNTNSIHENYGWKDYEFLKYFDKQILSYRVNAVKPELKIYKAVEAYTQSPPEEHIFIDDIRDYVIGAKNAGWDAVQFTGYDKLISDFHERKIF